MDRPIKLLIRVESARKGNTHMLALHCTRSSFRREFEFRHLTAARLPVHHNNKTLLCKSSTITANRSLPHIAIFRQQVFNTAMDQMMSYCGQPISDDSADACIDYSFSPKELIQYSNEYEASSMNEADRDLIKQCDNYRAQIKRQEEEINSYRKHIEVIEEEYSKLSTHLSAAEKNIRQKDKQLSSYQETIGSLKNELDSFYTLERSFHEDSLTKSDISLSFSSDSNIKVCKTGLQ